MFVPDPPFLVKVLSTSNFFPSMATLKVGDLALIEAIDREDSRGVMVAPYEDSYEWGIMGIHYELYEGD